MPHIRAAHPEVTRDDVNAILAKLPERTARPRAVELEVVEPVIASSESTDARAIANEKLRISMRAGGAVRNVLQTLPLEDRTLIRLRFGSDMSVADISRMMNLPQRPLYRRLESLLFRLRGALTEAGIDGATAESLVGREHEIDFGLMNGKNDGARRSIDWE